ncbi:M55 family metallopeptidase [Streptomyces shenzhenensis]
MMRRKISYESDVIAWDTTAPLLALPATFPRARARNCCTSARAGYAVPTRCAQHIRFLNDEGADLRNPLPEELDRRAHLVRGRPRPLGMLGGIDEHTDAVLLVGYHARAGRGPAVLAHTMNDGILDVRVAGRSMGEIGLNAAMAGHLGLPVVLLSGDDSACAELSDLVPSTVTVAVKQALGQGAAVALHPAEARDRLRRAAAEAVTRRAQVSPLVLAGPLEVEVDLSAPFMVDLATLVPETYRLLLLLAQLATIKPG